MLDGTFLEGVDASKRRWHDPSAQQRGILPAYRWTGPGRDGLEVAYGNAESRPNAATVREVWKQRHGYRAAPLLLVVTYTDGPRRRAVLCGPAGDDPRVVDLDYEQAERMAAAALGEPDRHLAIRFLSEALEGEPDEHPGLRNKGLLATHELLYGVPKRDDWDDATARSRPLLGQRGQDLIRGLGYEIEQRARHSVLRSPDDRAQAVAVFLQESEQADQPSSRFENQTPVTYARSLTPSGTTSPGWSPRGAAGLGCTRPRPLEHPDNVAVPRRSSSLTCHYCTRIRRATWTCFFLRTPWPKAAPSPKYNKHRASTPAISPNASGNGFISRSCRLWPSR